MSVAATGPWRTTWMGNRHAAVISQLRIPSLTPSQPLAASFSSAAVKQEQRIRFDCLRRVASPQLALRRFDRRPDPLRRVGG